MLRKLVGRRSNASTFGTLGLRPAAGAALRDGDAGDLARARAGQRRRRALTATLRPRGLIAAPLALGRRSLGVLVVCTSERPEPYGDEELEIAKELARKAAMAVENSRLFEAEQERSKALQLSLLGRPR